MQDAANVNNNDRVMPDTWVIFYSQSGSGWLMTTFIRTRMAA